MQLGNPVAAQGPRRAGRALVAVSAASAAIWSVTVVRADWPEYAGGDQRAAIAPLGPADVSARLWLAATDLEGQTLVFEGPSTPVVFGGRVFANARHFAGQTHTNNKLVAFDRQTGAVLFERLVARGVLDSWSSPAVDSAHNTVLLASGSAVAAIDAASGELAWTTPLDRPVVNASPLVPDGLSPARAFITDYDPFGGAGSLYCINTSPFDAGGNPYQPGDIVWQEPIGGSSGATPAWSDGTVFVAVASGLDGFPDAGVVHAFDVDAPFGQRLRWSVTVGEGFFGGVCVVGGHVYAAGYNFSGSGDNSTLVKIRAADGALVWTVPCERTASTPIVRGDRIYLSAGLNGFGSAPKVQAFRDDGASATKLWDTWTDTGGTLVVGGWTHQPVLAGDILYVGKIPASGPFFAPYTELFLLDVTRTPTDPGFVRQQRPGVGSSPALCGGRLFSIGASGLHALAACGDFDADGAARGPDVQPFVAALTSPAPSPQEIALGDANGDEMLDAADAALLAEKLLRNPPP